MLEVTFAVTTTKLNEYFFFFFFLLNLVCFTLLFKNLGRKSWVSYMPTTGSLRFMLLNKEKGLT